MKTTFASSFAVVAVAIMTITAQAAALPTAALPTPAIIGDPSATLSGLDRIQSSTAIDHGGSLVVRAHDDDLRYIHLNSDGDVLVVPSSRQKPKASGSSSQHKSEQSQGSEVPKPKDESKEVKNDDFKDFLHQSLR
ncbi:hypothetical protein F5050DRAFT_1735988 [Lentinula boryana]|uniref:Uncharacterized protein n=1 Tax=Lentinula boryana TaxID=40481 RepID=A0ABQ8QM56_9AGAR|nr:hypothetical protein F5050DRAFT_1735988 [Lentinula boryana]